MASPFLLLEAVMSLKPQQPMQQTLTPMELRCLNALALRCCDVFRLKRQNVVVKTANDSVQGVGQQNKPEYPSLEISVTEVARGSTYTSAYLRRNGLTVVAGNNVSLNIRLTPQVFTIGLAYKTLSYTDALSQACRLTSLREGSFNSVVRVGSLEVALSTETPTSVSIPIRESVVDSEPVYILETTLTLNGYSSVEKELAKVATLTTITAGGVTFNFNPATGEIENADGFTIF